VSIGNCIRLTSLSTSRLSHGKGVHIIDKALLDKALEGLFWGPVSSFDPFLKMSLRQVIALIVNQVLFVQVKVHDTHFVHPLAYLSEFQFNLAEILYSFYLLFLYFIHFLHFELLLLLLFHFWPIFYKLTTISFPQFTPNILPFFYFIQSHILLPFAYMAAKKVYKITSQIYTPNNLQRINQKYIVNKEITFTSQFTGDDLLDIDLLINFRQGLNEWSKLILLNGTELLSLFMSGIFQTLDVHFLVVNHHLTPVAHLLHCRSYLHFLIFIIISHTTNLIFIT
jgi:hypothetical protein